MKTQQLLLSFSKLMFNTFHFEMGENLRYLKNESASNGNLALRALLILTYLSLAMLILF